MSLRGRYVVDRLKRATARYFLLPVPPYESSNYWEGVYQSFGPNDVFEWGDLHFSNHLQQYQYTALPAPTTSAAGIFQQQQPQPPPEQQQSSTTATITTTWGETLNVDPVPVDQLVSSGDPTKSRENDEPILILGCGNSKLGEDMLEPRPRPLSDDIESPSSSSSSDTLVRWRGPILQVDVSSRVIDAMGQRCNAFIESGDMMVIQDDASELSAISNQTVNAVVDKGLLDALFCANNNQAQLCYDVMQSVHRVLKPNGVFALFSFSRPEFLLETLLVPPYLHTNNGRTNSAARMIGGASSSSTNKRAIPWGDVQIRQLDSIMLYRFQKAAAPAKTQIHKPNSRARKQQQQQQHPSTRPGRRR